MNDTKDSNVTVKIIVDGECVHEGDTHGVLVLDDNGSYSTNINGLVGAVTMICKASNHFSRAIIDIKDDTPFDMVNAKILELLKARMMLAAMCSSMSAFGEIHDLKEFRDTANRLHDEAIEILDDMDGVKMKDAED